MQMISAPKFPIHGGCQCGAVRYTLHAPPVVFYLCHCTECQKQSSSAYGESMRVSSADLEICGETKTFRRPATVGGHMECSFCGTCGSRLFHGRPQYGGKKNIKAGTLDDTSWLVPAGHIWTRSKQPHVAIASDALAYDGQPEDDYAALIGMWNRMIASDPR